MSSAAIYAKEIGRHPLLSEQEEDALISELLRTGSPICAKRLAEGNLRLVVAIAHSFQVRSQDLLADLIQEGNVGLLEAAKRFDRGFGVKFSTYATEWIRGSMLHHLTAKTRHASREVSITKDVMDSLGRDDHGVDTLITKRIRKFVRTLHGRERDIFTQRLCSKRPMTLEELGRRHQISGPRVRVIEQRVLRQFKREMRPRRELLAA